MDRPPPDPAKLLSAWMEWERGETPPGRVMSNLKTGGLRDLLEGLVAQGPVAAAQAASGEAGEAQDGEAQDGEGQDGEGQDGAQDGGAGIGGDDTPSTESWTPVV